MVATNGWYLKLYRACDHHEPGTSCLVVTKSQLGFTHGLAITNPHYYGPCRTHGPPPLSDVFHVPKLLFFFFSQIQMSIIYVLLCRGDPLNICIYQKLTKIKKKTTLLDCQVGFFKIKKL